MWWLWRFGALLWRFGAWLWRFGAWLWRCAGFGDMVHCFGDLVHGFEDVLALEIWCIALELWCMALEMLKLRLSDGFGDAWRLLRCAGFTKMLWLRKCDMSFVCAKKRSWVQIRFLLITVPVKSRGRRKKIQKCLVNLLICYSAGHRFSTRCCWTATTFSPPSLPWSPSSNSSPWAPDTSLR